MLLDAVIAAISRSQPTCNSVLVTVHPDNEVALSLYQSAGFRRTGEFSGIEPVLSLDFIGRDSP
jgi:ribosomal protein S18 acetylase RimI-like enzyme